MFALYKAKKSDDILNFPKDDQVLQYLLHSHPDAAHNFHLHDSLLENKPDEDLDEDEKKEAWNSYVAESTNSANRFANALQNNANLNLQASLFGKPGDYSKYYHEIQSLYNSWNMGSIMPSATSALDPYYPLPSNLYTNEFFKRIGTYDALNLYPSAPTMSSLASPLPSSSATSSLMSSLLRNPLNPISALGNMTTPATTSTTGSTSSTALANLVVPAIGPYNANNIPPASNSMFSSPTSGGGIVRQGLPTIGSSVSSTIASGTSLLANKSYKDVLKHTKNYTMKPIGSSNNNNIIGNVRNQKKANVQKLQGRRPINDNLNVRKVGGPLVVAANSSENLSILPDDTIATTTTTAIRSGTSSNGLNSLNASSPRLQKSASNTSVSSQNSNLSFSSFSRANMKKPVVTPAANYTGLKNKPVGVSPSAVRTVPISNKVTNLSQEMPRKTSGSNFPKSNPIPEKVLMTRKAVPQATIPVNQQRTKSLNQIPVVSRKVANTNVLRSPVQMKAAVQDKLAGKQLATPPSKAILSQLEKNHTSLIGTTTKTNVLPPLPMQQKQSQIANTSPQNSVSIIKLPHKNIPTTSQSISNVSLQQKVSPKTTSTIRTAIAQPELQKVIQQPAKRVTDTITTQAFKKIKLSHPQTNSQQLFPSNFSQRMNDGQTQRMNKNKTMGKDDLNQILSIN